MGSLYHLIEKHPLTRMPDRGQGEVEYFGWGVLVSDRALRPLLDANRAARFSITANARSLKATVRVGDRKLAISRETGRALGALAAVYAKDHPNGARAAVRGAISVRAEPGSATLRAAAPEMRHGDAMEAVKTAATFLKGIGWRTEAEVLLRQAAETWSDLSPRNPAEAKEP